MVVFKHPAVWGEQAVTAHVPGGRISKIIRMIKDGKTGHLIEPGDLAKLKERLAKLANDAPLRTALGQAGRKLVEEEFTVDQLVERQSELYKRLLA